MPSQTNIDTVAGFIRDAPPGELSDVIADIKTLTAAEPAIAAALGPAFQHYNEEQFTTAKLPGGTARVVITAHNSLGNGRYYDVESSSSFDFDHATQKASGVQSHVLESEHADLVKSTLKSLGPYVKEHFRDASYGVFPAEGDSKVAVVIVANKYSPKNYWNGRWRSLYIFDPATGTLDGTINVDVHYYEDGNVRLQTGAPGSRTTTSSASSVAASGAAIVREIAASEKRYQDDVNRGFSALSEGAFKTLRRQLPVTRQKIEWDKITSYRLGQDIGGGSSKR